MDLHLRVPSIPMGELDSGSIQVLISFALGIVAIFLSALANRFHWSAKTKSIVVILVCIFCGVMQLALQGLLDGVHALKAAALILLSSQAFYQSKPIFNFAAKLEKVTTPGESIRDFLRKPELTFEIPTREMGDHFASDLNDRLFATPPPVPDPPVSEVPL
ncbi:MAG: hypothetical protein V4671_19560 [Armatimonadota bacterium]